MTTRNQEPLLDPEPCVRWTKRALEMVLPGPRNIPERTLAPANALGALRRLAELVRPTAARWRAGGPHGPVGIEDRLCRVLDSYEDPEAFLQEPLDVGVETVRAAMLDFEFVGVWDRAFSGTHGCVVPPSETTNPALDLWCAASGLGLALEATTRGAQLVCVDAQDGWDPEGPLILATRPTRQFAGSNVVRVWRELRWRVASATPAEYAHARVAAGQLREQLDEQARLSLAFAFPAEQDWCRADARPSGEPWSRSPRASWLLACVQDPAVLVELATWVSFPDEELIYTLVHNLGLDAVPVLTQLSDRAGARDVSLRDVSVAALLMIDSPDVVAFVVSRLAKRHVARNGATYLRRLRHWALPELERASPVDPVAAALLAGLRERDGSAHEPTAIAPRPTGPLEPPASFGLPPLLVSPPWLVRPNQAIRTLDLRAIPQDTHIVPIDPPPRPSSYDGYHWSRHHSPEELRRLLRQHLAANTPQCFDPEVLRHLPDEEAREVWLRSSPAFWEVREGEGLLALLDRFGAEALPKALECAHKHPAVVLPALMGTFSPEVATTVADVLPRSKSARGAARAWLARHADRAAVALLPVALGRKGQPRLAAIAALRTLVADGHQQHVRAAARRYAVTQDALDEVLLRDEKLENVRKSPVLPAFWAPMAWTRPLCARDRRAIPVDALDALGGVLKTSPLDVPSATLLRLREWCDRRSLGAFAWDLFQAWRTSGSPSNESWAFQALGVLGDDVVCSALVPFIHQWPLVGQTGYAATALDVLATIGSEASLVELQRISQRFKSRGLKDRAAAKLQEVAEARGLTAEQLADRLVPDMGLDAAGGRDLDFGARLFRIGIDTRLRPYVANSSGERLKELPAAGRLDDPVKASVASEVWKAFKKELRRQATLQRNRLEWALCARRRWSAHEFDRFVLGHPLLVHFARSLVWGAFDGDGRLQATFRVAEDGSLADPNDQAFVLSDSLRVGLPHPLDLTPESLSRWSQVLSDYDVLQPFQQVGRPVFPRTDGDRGLTQLALVTGRRVPTSRVLGLESRGWRRLGDSGGMSRAMAKAIPGTSLQAELDLDPGIFAMVGEFPEQTLGQTTLVRRRRDSLGIATALPFDQLDALAWSELVADLTWLGS